MVGANLFVRLCTKEIDQAPVAPKLGGKVEEFFGIAIDWFIQPVHHRAAYAGMGVYVLAGNTRLAIANSPFPPYPVDGYLEADGFGNVA